MPQLKETEHIDSIFCEWEQTFVRTQKGRIHSTVKNVEKKKEREQVSYQKIPHKRSKDFDFDDDEEYESFDLPKGKQKKKKKH